MTGWRWIASWPSISVAMARTLDQFSALSSANSMSIRVGRLFKSFFSFLLPSILSSPFSFSSFLLQFLDRLSNINSLYDLSGALKSKGKFKFPFLTIEWLRRESWQCWHRLLCRHWPVWRSFLEIASAVGLLVAMLGSTASRLIHVSSHFAPFSNASSEVVCEAYFSAIFSII